MITKKQITHRVKRIVGTYFDSIRGKENRQRGNRKIMPLMSRLYDESEIAEVVDTLLTPDKLTLNARGPLKIERFENLWSGYIGVKNGIMVNSGSSANLVAFYILTNPAIKNRLKPGDEVIVPALNWATSITPLYALGLKPVFVDVNLENYCMDPVALRKAISPRTKAILVIHLLGFPAEMTEIMKIAREHRLYVIEDCCESHGAEYRGKKVGSFGDISTFSFYLSHHITTLEGGMLMTNNNEFAELARIMRSQGVMRNVKNQRYKKAIERKYSNIDPRYLFVNTGYNFRPTEMEGAFGLVQFKRFRRYLKMREVNARRLNEIFKPYGRYFYFLPALHNKKCSWFVYPILLRKNTAFTRKDLVDFLEKHGVETRQVMSGNYLKQPVARMFRHRVAGKLANTKYIDQYSFLIGVHAGITERALRAFAKLLDVFLKKYER
ncbi:MAG: aminotransferase class I/II-fold pyridoxal phosphate-dependent enzyme [bacterium]|nr:aminotransferase class I/II-fold pyridoxal phosphate-dependent enzyme [bacterium]